MRRFSISIMAWPGPFVRRFELADYVSVIGAKLENGLLIIDLKKEIPEEMRPRRIAIKAEAIRSRLEADRRRVAG